MQRLHQKPCQRTDDQRIFGHRQQYLLQFGRSAPEILQYDHRQYVENGYHDGDHQRRYTQIAAGQQLHGDGKPQQYEVAAKGRLDHHTPPLGRFFRQQCHHGGNQYHGQGRAHHQQYIGQPHRLREV